MATKKHTKQEAKQNSYLTVDQVNEIINSITNVAALDFSHPVSLKNDGSIFDTLALGLNMICEELSDSIVSKKALEQSETNFRRAQKIAHLGHWTLDLKNNVLDWSNEVYRIFGLKKSEFEATYESFLNFVHPEDREAVNEAYTKHITTQEPYKHQHRIVTAKGEMKWVEESCESEFSAQGKCLFSIGTVHDITEKKILTQNQASLKAAVHQSNAVCEFDLEGNILFVNDKFAELFEYEPGEMIGISHSTRVPPTKEAQTQYDILWKTLKKGEFVSGTFERKTKSNRTIQITGSYNPIFDAFGKLQKVIKMGIDSTSEKRILDEAERLLNDITNNERQFRSLFNNSAIGIVLVEPYSHQILDTNETLAASLGYSQKELKKLRFLDIRAKYKNQPKSVIEEFRNIQEALKYQPSVMKETELLHKDGSIIPVTVNIANGMYGDAIPVLVAYVRDITLQKKAERAKNVISNLAHSVGNPTISVEEFCEALHEQLKSLIAIEGFYVSKLEGEDLLNFPYIKEFQNIYKLPYSRLKGNGLSEYVIKTKKPLLLNKNDLHTFRKKEGLTVYSRPEKAWMGVPILRGDRVIGMFACQMYSKDSDYTPEDLTVLTQVGLQLGNFLEQKATNEALRESEQLYRSLFETMNEGILLADKNGTITFTSPQFQKMSQYSAQELLGKKIADFLPIQSKKIVQDQLAKRKSGENNTYEVEVIGGDGGLKWVNISASPIFKPNGEFDRSLSIISDISQRKATEAQRLVTNRALNAASEGIVITDPNQKDNPVIFINTAFHKITGYSLEDIIGKNCRILNGESTDKITIQKLKAAIKSKSYVKCEILNYKKNGTPFWNELSITPVFDESKKVVNYIGFQRDITLRKKAQLREEVVFAIAKKANSILPDIQYLCTVIHREIKKALNAQNLYVALINPAENTISFPYVIDTHIKYKNVQEKYETRKMASGLTEKVIGTRKPLLINTEEQRKKEDPKTDYSGKIAKCWLGVPLISDGATVGALVIQSYDDANAFSEEDLDFLVYVSNQISSLIERIQTHLDLLEHQEELIDQRIKTLEHQSKLLSTQLNPHFIFNSLNSIQYYILDNDAEPALHFLSKFSTLMRSVLDNSEHLHISLEKEIKFLSLYLDLEMGRYIGKFDYKIEISEDINEFDALIPPMLLQPYIENTIIHGVGHLSTGGEIRINFEEKGDFIHCIITDNGVGRKRAHELKKLKSGGENYNSRSTDIISNRITILKEIDHTEYSATIEDLFDDKMNSRGTKVTVIFPYLT